MKHGRRPAAEGDKAKATLDVLDGRAGSRGDAGVGVRVRRGGRWRSEPGEACERGEGGQAAGEAGKMLAGAGGVGKGRTQRGGLGRRRGGRDVIDRPGRDGRDGRSNVEVGRGQRSGEDGILFLSLSYHDSVFSPSSSSCAFSRSFATPPVLLAST